MKKIILGLLFILGSNVAKAQCEGGFEDGFDYVTNYCAPWAGASCATNSISNGRAVAIGLKDRVLFACVVNDCINGGIVTMTFTYASYCDPDAIPYAKLRGRLIGKPKLACGSIVQAENQVVGESIPVVGTSFSMNYFTLWSQGRIADYKFDIPLASNTPRSNISSFGILIKDGSTTIQSTSYVNNQANLVHTYTWNGLDASNNPTLGARVFDITLTEHRATMSIPVTSKIVVGSLKAKLFGLGGWLPSIYNFYDATTKVLYKGDGSKRNVEAKTLTSGFYVAETDGSLVYYFDSQGRHTHTKTGLTGQTIYTFNYDSSGRLSSIDEPFSRTTTFNRNSSGVFTGITASNGQFTSVVLDSNGFVASITNPNSEVYSITYYGTNGLIETFTKPGTQTSTFTYDANGNLTKDEHSGGYFFDLVKVLNGYDLDFKTVSKLGRETKYQGTGEDNSINRTTTYPTGRTETYNYSDTTSSANEAISQNGYGMTNGYLADQRFGDQVMFPSYTTFGFGTVYYGIVNTQNIALSDPNDPFSITNYSINSQKGSFNVTTDYDPSTKKFSTYSALGNTSETAIDNYERIASQKRGNLYPVEFTYTNEHLTKIKQNSRETDLTYNSTTGYLSTITNPLSQTTAFTYNSAGRVASKILPDLRTITYSYDANGNISGITPPGRTIHSFGLNANELPSSYEPPTLSGVTTVNTAYTYDDDKQLTEILRPTGDSIEYNYNLTSGVLETVVTPAGTYNFTMSITNGLPTVISAPNGINTAMSYAGTIPNIYNVYDGSTYMNTYSMTHASNGTVSDDTVSTYTQYDQIYYTYDNDEYLTGAGDLTLTYSTPSALLTGTSIGTSPNIVTDEYTYNSFGEVTNYKAKYGTTVIYDLTLGRDGMGRINSKTQTMNSTTDAYGYAFDTTGRLTHTTKNSTTVATYDYDDNSNRDGGSIGGITTTATYDAQDRMTAYNQLTFTYNANGDLTSKTHTLLSTTTSYTYDVFGNLTSVTLPVTGVITYEIDGLNRRVGKLKNGVVEKRWIYMDQTRIAAEVDSSGNITKRFVYGSKSNIPDYMIMGDENYRIISDHLGSPRLVVKVSDGTIASRVDHDEYGRVNLATSFSPDLLPFGFAGGLYDEDTQLVRFGARDYDPETGRWTAKDPILFAGDQANLYGYTFSDPINWIDPTGQNATEYVDLTSPLHRVLGVGQPGQATTYIDFYPIESVGMSPVNGQVDIWKSYSGVLVPIPGKTFVLDAAKDKQIIQRAKVIQEDAQKGLYPYSLIGDGKTCVGFIKDICQGICK